MSIADQITRLSNAKAAIKTSIENKGVTVGNDVKLDAYPALIDSIEAGGGSGETHINPDFYELRTQNGTNYDNLFREYNGPDIDVSQWDTSKVTSARYCFYNCINSMNISNWDLSILRDSAFMFGYFTNGNKYIDLSVLDFSNVTNVTNMFSYSDTNYLDVRNINLTGTNSYSYLFYGCKGDKVDLSSWDISNITNLSNMFGNSYLKKIDLTGWKTVNVTNFSSMFYGYTSYLKELIIPDWDMTNATNTSSFIYTSRSVLEYVDLSRSNDLTIKKIASFLPTKTATAYGEILVPADTSQDAIDALMAKYWKPIGPKFDLNSTELVLELDEIKPGKTTKICNGNSDPWYGDDRPEAIEFISSDESIATVNGREITSTGVEGTVTIECRRREDNVVIGSTTLTVSETDSRPNLIKFRTNGSESSNNIIFCTIDENMYTKDIFKDSITGLYYYELTDPTYFSIRPNSFVTTYITEFVKFNLNLTSLERSFEGYIGKTLDFSCIDTSKIKFMSEAFQNCNNLTEIIGELDLSETNSVRDMFYNSPKLETLYLKNIYKNCTMSNDGKWSINLGDTKIKNECLLYIINELPDLYAKGLTKTDRITFTLPQTNTLTQEQIAIGIAKGWTFINVNN